MPLVNLRIDNATRQLWVEAAEGEGVTLSEWLRRAADARLGLADRYIDKPLSLDSEEQRSVGEETAAAVPADQGAAAAPTQEPQAPTGTADWAKPQTPPAWTRDFRPDPKPVSKKKR